MAGLFDELDGSSTYDNNNKGLYGVGDTLKNSVSYNADRAEAAAISAEDSAAAAKSSEEAAALSADNASGSEGFAQDASDSADAAALSEGNAAISAGNAVTSENNAATSADEAAQSALDAAAAVGNITVQKEFQTATEGQTVFTLTTFDYPVGANTLNVHIDGRMQYVDLSYTETNSTTVTFSEGLSEGQTVMFNRSESEGASTLTSSTAPETGTVVNWHGLNLLKAEMEALTPSANGYAVRCTGRTAANDGYDGFFVWQAGASEHLVTADPVGAIYVARGTDPTGSTGVWARQYYGMVNLRWFGAYENAPAAQNTPALKAAVDFMDRDNVGIFIPEGTYEIDQTIQIGTLLVAGTDEIHIKGNGRRDAKTRLDYTGEGPLFQLSEDDGGDWDANTYDGVAGFALSDIELYANGIETPLLSAHPTLGRGYRAGVYGVRDWRGGGCIFKNVTFSGFEYGYWGIQADVSVMDTILLTYNKVGMFFGPRSDQLVLDNLYSFRNDYVIHMDGIEQARVNNWQTVKDGSATTNPLLIQGSTTTPSEGLTFRDCWFEHFGADTTQRSYVKIEVGTTVASNHIYFINPTIHQNSLAGEPDSHSENFIEFGGIDNLYIFNPSGDIANFENFLSHNSTSTGYAHIEGNNLDRLSTIEYRSSGHANVTLVGTGSGTNLETRSRTGRITARTMASESTTQAEADEKSFELQPVTGGGFKVTRPDTVDEANNPQILTLTRRIIQSGVSPTSLVWEQGDIVFNRSPSSGEFAGWICVTSGDAGIDPTIFKGFGLIEA